MCPRRDGLSLITRTHMAEGGKLSSPELCLIASRRKGIMTATKRLDRVLCLTAVLIEEEDPQSASCDTETALSDSLDHPLRKS